MFLLATDVMADDLAQNLVDHRHVGLAANMIAELRLYHREHGLDVAPGRPCSIANKISRGTFSATFRLASLKAIEVDSLRLENV